MKRIILLALAVVTLPVYAGREYVVETIVPGGTSAISAGSASSAYNYVFDVRERQLASLQATFKLTGAGTGNVIFYITKSDDGTNYTTAETAALTVAGNGTSTVSGQADITVNGVGFIKVTQGTNSNASAVTNLVLTIAGKQNSDR